MITEQGRGFPFQLGREIPWDEIKMIVSQTTEAGIQTNMTGQGTDDQWAPIGESDTTEMKTETIGVSGKKDPIELEGKKKSILVQNRRC